MKYSGFGRDVKCHVPTFSTSGQRQVTTFCTCAMTSRKKSHVSGCHRRADDLCCLRCLLRPANIFSKYVLYNKSIILNSIFKYHHPSCEECREGRWSIDVNHTSQLEAFIYFSGSGSGSGFPGFPYAPIHLHSL